MFLTQITVRINRSFKKSVLRRTDFCPCEFCTRLKSFPLKIHRSTRGGRVERSSLRRSNRAGSGRASNRDPTEVQRLKRIRRAKANDRERNRMHMLNVALEKLRVVLPAFPGKYN